MITDFQVYIALMFAVSLTKGAHPYSLWKCGNEAYTDSLFNKIVLKVFPSKHFTIS